MLAMEDIILTLFQVAQHTASYGSRGSKNLEARKASSDTDTRNDGDNRAFTCSNRLTILRKEGINKELDTEMHFSDNEYRSVGLSS
jgi:hypothetical protein